jgi:hypothetical protein
MKLTAPETRFLTALAREQNQSGCRGPAHDLLRKHVYPDAPLPGPGSLSFAYEAVPLTGILLEEFTELQAIDDFLRKAETIADPGWHWSSAEDYRARLAEARAEWTARRLTPPPAGNGTEHRDPIQPSTRTGTGG